MTRVLDRLEQGQEWRLLAFNSEEDLVLMTNDGKMFIVDFILERIKDKVELREYVLYPGDSNLIADAKLEQAFNTLVFRTIDANFFWVPNVVTGI